MRRSVTGRGPLAAHPRHRGPGPRLDRRHLREHRAAPRPGHLRRPRARRTTSAATGSTWTATATAAPPSCSPTASARSPPPGPGSPARSPRPPGSAPTTAPGRAGARTPTAPRTASSRPRTCTRCSPRPASTAPTCWSGTPPAAPTRMTYAARYPEQVAGMVLLDSSSPEQLTRMPAYPGQYAVMRRGLALLPTLSRLGLGRPRPRPPTCPPRRPQGRRDSPPPRGPTGTQRDEVSVDPRGLRPGPGAHHAGRPTARRAHRLRVSSTEPTAGPAPRTSSPRSRPTPSTAPSTPPTPGCSRTPPGGGSVRAITEVISSVRTGTPLRSR